MKLRGLIITMLILTTTVIRSQIPLSSPIFLLPAGEEKEGQPVFRIMTSKDAEYRKARQLFDRGFVNHVVTLYKMAQQYQVTHGKLSRVEEAYLAFTSNNGGFARTGFWLQTEKGLEHKANAGYVDLHKNCLGSERDEVAAPPQIFNHEMGHLILNVLTLTPEDQRGSHTLLMHYFTTVTDYVTAFDEGFAEHLQYLTYEFERNKKVKDTIESELRHLKMKIPHTLYGYERDYNLPLRMGFFTATMPLWYQKVENIRRYSFITNNWAKMPARIAQGITSKKNYIQYRNASVWPSPAKKYTYAQSMSVEGIMASFFVRVVMNDMNKDFTSPEFYREFIPDTAVKVPQQVDVTTNQYLKMFKVIASSVSLGSSPGGPFTNFMEAYIKIFPQETAYIKSCWETSSGLPYVSDPAPEVWVMNPSFSFYPYAMGPYGPSLPAYAFNLNTADSVDLMTFGGITVNDAEKILSWRLQNNGFKQLSDIEKTPGVDNEKLRMIAQSGYDNAKAESVNNQSLSFTGFIAYPLIHLLKMALLWFVIIGVMYAIALYLLAGLTPTPRRLTMLLLKVLLFTLAGLILRLFMEKQLLLMLAITVIVMGINFFVNRKKEKLLWLSLGSTLLIGIVMLYSLY